MHKTKQNACTMQCIDCILHARWNMFCFVLSGTCMQNKTEHIFECMRYTINALHHACACVLFVLCKVGRACRTKHMLPCMYACNKQSTVHEYVFCLVLCKVNIYVASIDFYGTCMPNNTERCMHALDNHAMHCIYCMRRACTLFYFACTFSTNNQYIRHCMLHITWVQNRIDAML